MADVRKSNGFDTARQALHAAAVHGQPMPVSSADSSTHSQNWRTL